MPGVQVEEKEVEVGSVRALLASADEALSARDAVVAALKAREATLAEKLDASKGTISEFEERVSSLRKISDSLQEQASYLVLLLHQYFLDFLYLLAALICSRGSCRHAASLWHCTTSNAHQHTLLTASTGSNLLSIGIRGLHRKRSCHL